MRPFFKFSFLISMSVIILHWSLWWSSHLQKMQFFNLALACNELVVKFLLSSLLSKLFCFKYLKFSLAVISWLTADKNCSMIQFSFPNFRLICNFIMLGNYSNIIDTNKGPKCSKFIPKLLNARTLLSMVSCNFRISFTLGSGP